jgi:glucose-1-phosphate thymidylyltransferase long form
MKGVIPAAGRGTRLEPVTLAIPKELLIVGDKAIIEYVIEAMKSVGVTDITIVVGWRKHAILDYLGSGERLGVKLTYVVQDNRTGLAKAVLTTEHVIGDEPFLIILGDNFFYPQTFLKDILAFHKEKKADVTIGVAEIEDTTRHGIIQPGPDNRILNMVEKPQPKDAPSNLGIIGVYIVSSSIFDAIRKIKPGVNNEYQLTDAIKMMIDTGSHVYYTKINGKHIDIGTMNDLKKANLFLSQQ